MAVKKIVSTKKKVSGSEKLTGEKGKEKKRSAASVASKVKKMKGASGSALKSRKRVISRKGAEVSSESETAPTRAYITPPPVVVPPPAKRAAEPTPLAPPAVTKPAPTKPAVPPPAAPPVKRAPSVASPARRMAPPPPPPTKKVERSVAKPKLVEKPKPAEVMTVVSEQAQLETPVVTKKKIQFNEMMSVKDLAGVMDMPVTEVIKKLLSLGTPASINQRISSETAALVAEAFGFELELKSIYVDERKEAPEEQAKLKSRPPVVTVMGHVDHGKTSLLDAIRSTSVVKGEAGGITQHIGAYQVKLGTGSITFLDTPGHEAFTAMRARGAMATDLVVLVVAADDSVMPQTIEAIDHAKAAGVPIVVAINKVDLPTANVQKVKQELAQHNLVAEDWGGKTVMVEVSAKTKHNLDRLLEMLLLEAELLELKANPDRPAKGVVLEAHMDPRRGIVATILVQAGTLRMGDVVVCGLTHGRVRAMLDDTWRNVEIAGPSSPVRMLGLGQVPHVGDQLAIVATDREAREIAERRKQFFTEASSQKPSRISLEGLHAKIAEGKIQELPIILKTDVQGSLQAIQDSLGKLAGSPIQLRFVHSGVGNINESDVLLAEASDAIVFGFSVKVETSAEVEAKRSGVDIRTYQIIYEMLADVKAAMEGLLKPEEREVVKGRAQVKGVFPSNKFGTIAGCIVTEGKVVRGAKAHVLRGGQLLATGSISSLRRFKDDVKEVEKGYECGLSVEGVKSFSQGDLIEAFVIEKHARRLDA